MSRPTWQPLAVIPPADLQVETFLWSFDSEDGGPARSGVVSGATLKP